MKKNGGMVLAAVSAVLVLQPVAAQAGTTYHATRVEEEYFNHETGRWEDAGYIQEKLDSKKRPLRTTTLRKMPMGEGESLDFEFVTKYHYRESGYTIATYLDDALVDREKYWFKDGKISKVKRYDENAELDSVTVYSYKDGHLTRWTDTDREGNKTKDCRNTYDTTGRLIRDKVAEYDERGRQENWYKTEYMYWENGKLKAAVTRDGDGGVRKIYFYSNGLVKKTREDYPDVGQFRYDYTYKYYKNTKDVPTERVCKEDGVTESRLRYSGFIKVPEDYESIPPRELLDF